MYTPQIIRERIKLMVKRENKSQKDVLATCQANENTLTQMSDKKGISSFTLAKIADELNCSVDYLLGRSDIPTINSGNTINQSNVNSDNSTVSIGAVENNNDLTQEFLKNFNGLEFSDKVKAMNFVVELKNK